MIRGSVVVRRRRCGKPNCHCADGRQLHDQTVLSYSEAGHSRTVILDTAEINAVRAAVGRYRAALARVEAAGNAGLAKLVERRAATRGHQ
jgi:hypothetical protein